MKKIKNPELSNERLCNDGLNDWLKDQKVGDGGEEFHGFEI